MSSSNGRARERGRKSISSQPWQMPGWLYGGVNRPLEIFGGVSPSSGDSNLSSPSIKGDTTNTAASKVAEDELKKKVSRIIEEIKKERTKKEKEGV